VRHTAFDPEFQKMSIDACYRYAMATLMNLSLRHDGKVECEAPSLRLLESLCDILEHENMQVRTYVNGTLYSLLTRQTFKDRAHALGLPEMLHCLADVQPPNVAHCARSNVCFPCRCPRRVSLGSFSSSSTRSSARYALTVVLAVTCKPTAPSLTGSGRRPYE
jgi:hypothetical protein